MDGDSPVDPELGLRLQDRKGCDIVLMTPLGTPELRTIFPGYPVTVANFRRFLA